MSRIPRPLVSIPLLLALAAFALQAFTGSEARAGMPSPYAEPVVQAELVNLPTLPRTRAPRRARLLIDFDSLTGRSGDLRVRILEAGETDGYPALVAAHGDEARRPGVRGIEQPEAANFRFVTMAPWRAKLGTHINGYFVGYWPGEQRSVTTQYENPAGFIEVTRDNVDTPLSTHFSLGDFITHDEAWVWPKYVVLREDLLDKLELVLDALESFGVSTNHIVVLSGFRSPQYNARGAGEGMARASRHQFGDAADIIVDANRDGRMDDLNGDGRVTFGDLQVIDQAVQRIEQRFPELVGGLGLYHEMGPSGPFAHIDVRGTRARWTNAQKRPTASPGWRTSLVARASGRCAAEGEMAVLCAGMK